jgi:transcriptional regulator with XRE-family HTH domain
MATDRIQELLAASERVNTGTRLTPARARFSTGTPDADEQRELAATVGALVRAVRTASGLSQAALADRMGAACSTVERLEAGQRRPTASLLASVVVAAGRTSPPRPPDRQAEARTVAQLLDAAGVSLVADTPGGLRRRERRLHEAGKRWARRFRQVYEAEQARRRAEYRAVTDAARLIKPGNLDNLAVLQRVHDLLGGAR